MDLSVTEVPVPEFSAPSSGGPGKGPRAGAHGPASVQSLRRFPAGATFRPDLPAAPFAWHSHRDAERSRPLWVAARHGATSFEADVHLCGGRVLVGHDRGKPGAYLEELYLRPLAEWLLGRGELPPPTTPIQLLIDIKSEGAATFRAIDRLLAAPYLRSVLTTVAGGAVRRGPLTVVISGNRPWELLRYQEERRAFGDGRIAGAGPIGIGADPALVPLVSERWSALFTWHGWGRMPRRQQVRLRDLAKRSHDHGHKLRFWGTPDVFVWGPLRRAVWAELAEAQVDYVTTDSWPAAGRFATAVGRPRG